MDKTERLLREAYAALHASEDTLTEVQNMIRQENKRGKRPVKRAAAILIAAILSLALGGAALAMGLIGLQPRETSPEERFRMYDTEDRWFDAKLSFEVTGPTESRGLRFKPGWLPREVPEGVLNRADEEGWYTRLTGESGSLQPYLIELWYAPQFVNGGHLIFLALTPEEITESAWGDWQLLKFDAALHRDPEVLKELGLEDQPEYRRSYCVMFHRTEGWILVLSGEQTDPDTLERIGKDLELDVTDEVISAADYQEYSVFIDGGKG